MCVRMLLSTLYLRHLLQACLIGGRPCPWICQETIMGKRQGYDYDATSHESNRSIYDYCTLSVRYSLDLRPITTVNHKSAVSRRKK